MRPLIADATRLLTRLRHPSPTGIDRVDLAYMRRYGAGAPDRLATAATWRGMRLLPAHRTAGLLRAIDERWRDDLPADEDPTFRAIAEALAGRAVGVRLRPTSGSPARHRTRDVLSRLRAPLWRPAEAAPRDAVYLHTSHLRLDRPQLFDWLSDRPDIRAVFFVHDIIPIEFPEYGVPGEAARHRVRMATVARHAAAIVVNSQDVADRLGRLLAAEGWRRPPVTVAPLGVEPAFLEQRRVRTGGRPYFVLLSTIEARKNHLLILQVWRELAARLGPDTPALVIVGRRGWESEAAVDLLDRCEAIRPHVIEATALSTAALAELVAGAQALLMPSFAEGYGIPVVEALSLGTPVIASDLPVFREIAGDAALLLHPLDGTGWLRAVERVAAVRLDPGHFRPPTWARHFSIVDQVLAGL